MRIVSLIVLGLTLQTAGQQSAQHFEDESLRGLDTFSVDVIGPKSDFPVKRDQLQTDVELRLRSLGISILPSAPVSLPFLEVIVSVTPVELGDEVPVYCFSILLTFRAGATLDGSGTRAIVGVWDTGSTGWTGRRVAEQSIRDGVRDIVDKFANAWLKTHPKESATKKMPDSDKGPDSPKP